MADPSARGPGGLNRLDACEASRRLGAGEITALALVEDCLERIAAREDEVGAWAHLDPQQARAQARARDREARRGPLHGVPVGIKDIFDTFDMPTAYGFAPLKGNRPVVDTVAVSLLRTAGAVILGKTVTTEFASPVPLGTRNPHDPTRSPGVSSSGSAAAVADCMVPLALGSQTGGSTILPAAYCGIVGYKASLTGIDRGNIRHLRPSLDTMGLMARSVADIALLRSVLAAGSPMRPLTVEAPPRIGVCRTITWSQAQPETVAMLERCAAQLAAAGAPIRDVDMPPVFQGIETSFRAISSLEGARALAAEVAAHPDAVNHWIKAGQATARTITQDKYDAAQLHAIACRRAVAEMLGQCDALITPAACGEAPADLVSVSNSAFNRIWTLMHVPCVTIPAASGPSGMPVGLQVVGPTGADDRTIAVADWIAGRLGGQPGLRSSGG